MSTVKPRLCLRHRLDLFSAALGGLLDLSGRAYPRFARRILAESRSCDRCSWPTPEVAQ